jgi:hypothetical protein
MSEEKSTPPQPSSTSNPSALSHPQVLTAIITGVVTLVAAFVGILPTLIQAGQPAAAPTQTPTPTATLTFTPAPTLTAELPTATHTGVPDVSPTATLTLEPVLPTATQTSIPTQIEVIVSSIPTLPPTNIPATTIQEPTVPMQTVQVVQSDPPNVLLIYDDAAFTVLNVSGKAMNLDGVRFRSDSGKFNASKFANSHSVPNDNCLRLRDSTAGRRNPPGECKNLLSFFEVGVGDLFWLNTPSFEVVRNGEILATCTTDTDRCAILIPQ